MMRPTDIDELQALFPDWQIGSVWASAAAGPDYRRLTARQGTTLITGWNKGEIIAGIHREERGY